MGIFDWIEVFIINSSGPKFCHPFAAFTAAPALMMPKPYKLEWTNPAALRFSEASVGSNTPVDVAAMMP